MRRPRLLDLFCGAGGAAMGYHRAGFEVVGVDINPQPHYPFEFHQGDAMTWPLEGFDAIHASPPCQAYSVATARWGEAQVASHPALIDGCRARLEAAGVPWVIENVETARWALRSPIMLCGTSFGLGAGRRELRRHRLFEMGGWDVLLVPPCAHRLRPQTITVVGGAGGKSRRDTKDGRPFANTADRLEAMGTPWMVGREVVEAIPPAYTEWIGQQLIRRRGSSMTRPLLVLILILLVGSSIATPRGASGPVPFQQARMFPEAPHVGGPLDPRKGNQDSAPRGPGVAKALPPGGASPSEQRTRTVAEMAAAQLSGTASWMPEKYGPDYLAMRIPRGTVVTICGAGGCWEDAVVMDYGPSGRLHPERIADIAVGRWTAICGVPASVGLCLVTADVVGPLALPETSTRGGGTTPDTARVADVPLPDTSTRREP